MLKIDSTDTIAAISTTIGESGIGIVRLSGQCALKIADWIFKSADKIKPSDFISHTIHYGWILDNKGSNSHSTAQAKVIDEVLISVMRSPKTYTREDVVEINCHGSIVSLRRILELVLKSGARLARPGEFTLRAFLNGRIDLAQAEAVLDIIRAKTGNALDLSVRQLEGELSKVVNNLRDRLLVILSELEAQIDFSDEDDIRAIKKGVSSRIKKELKQINGILSAGHQGRILRDGVNVVICGKPNAGKSSLLNMILREERAIVSPIAGTTRDTIEEFIDIKGIPLRFVDTAGLIEPRGLVEKKAISRARKFLEEADLVLLVFDNSKTLDRQDKEIIKDVAGKKSIAVLNKIDLKRKIDPRALKNIFLDVVKISAKNNVGLEELESAILSSIWQGKVVKTNNLLINNLRHLESLRKVQEFLFNALSTLSQNLSLEFVCLDVKLAVERLGEITGQTIQEEVLENIFKEFCIGK
jgi:tRNA modification GTPase